MLPGLNEQGRGEEPCRNEEDVLSAGRGHDDAPCTYTRVDMPTVYHFYIYRPNSMPTTAFIFHKTI